MVGLYNLPDDEDQFTTDYADQNVLALDHSIEEGIHREGNIATPYLDHLGHPTIGIGLLLSKDGRVHNEKILKRHLAESFKNNIELGEDADPEIEAADPEIAAQDVYDRIMAQGEQLKEYRAKHGVKGPNGLTSYQKSPAWTDQAVTLPEDLRMRIYEEIMQKKQTEVLNLYGDLNLNYLHISTLTDIQFQGPSMIGRKTRFYKALTDPNGPRWNDAIWEVLYDSGDTCTRNKKRARDLDMANGGDGVAINTTYPYRPFPPGVPKGHNSKCN